MGEKKRSFIGLTIFSTILSLLAVAIYKLFPKMKKCCEGMREKLCPKGPEGKKK